MAQCLLRVIQGLYLLYMLEALSEKRNINDHKITHSLKREVCVGDIIKVQQWLSRWVDACIR